MVSTPFAKWLEDGEEQPYGGDYENEAPAEKYPSEVIAMALVNTGLGFSKIMWLTMGKERLRWLSRKLYRLAVEHEDYNKKRATMLNGEMTDDELANAFFLSETKEDLQAGHDRIMWLAKEIKLVTQK